MSNKSKREYLKKVIERYFKADREEKKRILDEFCANCGYNRKYAIRLLNQQRKTQTKSKRRGPKVIYDGLVTNVLHIIWKTSGYLCSRRLKAAIALYLPSYKIDHSLSEDTEQKLLKISHQTIDRKLKPFRLSLKRRRFCTTRPGKLLKHQIPIKTDNWDVTKPGFLECDTVVHCGDSLVGDYIYSVGGVDILTGWTEYRAVWNKGQQGVLSAIKDIEGALPFPLLGFDSDNGGEFLNYHLYRYCEMRSPHKRVQFTRSRPYKKDDNAHIEQKNWTHVRQLIGYTRLDNPQVVGQLNDLYKGEWNWFNNYYCPSMKLISKKRVGSRIVKVYDSPKTPCQRVLECSDVVPETKERLREFFSSLNPFQLNAIIEQKVADILDNARLPKL